MKTFTGFTTEFKKLAARQSVSIGVMVLTALTIGVHKVEAVAPVGVKLMVQPWDPIRDDDSVTTLYDSNDAITSALNSTWDKVKPKLINSMTTQLTTPNLFADGVTLYDVKLNINTPEISIAPDGTAGFVAKLLVRDTYLEATSTTPDIALGIGFGSYADPRCSVRFSVDLTLKLGVTDDKARLLEVRYGPNDAPVLVKDFKADSQNAPCDIAKFLAGDAAKLFAGKDFWKWMTDEINNPQRKEYKQLNDAIKQELNSALVAVNAQMKVPAQYARLRVWARKDKLTVLFGVRELPLPARVASARGRLAIGDLKGLSSPISNCDQLRMTATVKTGPSPVLDPSGTQFGDPPMVAVGKLRGSAFASLVAGQTCDYTVDQLVPGFPNLITFGVPQPTVAPNSSSRKPTIVYAFFVQPESWNYGKALHPQPSIGGLNLTLLATNVSASGFLELDGRARHIDKGDPLKDIDAKIGKGVLDPQYKSPSLVNPSKTVSPAPGSGSMGMKSSSATSALLLPAPSALPAGNTGLNAPAPQTLVKARSQLKNGNAAALNPQPLPPESPVSSIGVVR
jgi:hypothetical protein